MNGAGMDIKRLQQRLADAGFYHKAVDRRDEHVLCRPVQILARKELGDKGLAIGEGCVASFTGAGIVTGLRLAHFLAQTGGRRPSLRKIARRI